MNRTNTQRSSAGPLRIVVIVCVLAILVLGVLYFMKRGEAKKLSDDLQLLRVERRGAEEELNSKLTDHLTKVETLTKTVSSLQTKLTQSEDDNAKCKDLSTRCQDSVTLFTQQISECRKGKEASDHKVETLQNQVETQQGQLDSLQKQLKNMQRFPPPQSHPRLPPQQPRQFPPQQPQQFPQQQHQFPKQQPQQFPPQPPQPPNVPHPPSSPSQSQPLNSMPQQQKPGVPSTGTGQSHLGESQGGDPGKFKLKGLDAAGRQTFAEAEEEDLEPANDNGDDELMKDLEGNKDDAA